MCDIKSKQQMQILEGHVSSVPAVASCHQTRSISSTFYGPSRIQQSVLGNFGHAHRESKPALDFLWPLSRPV